MFFWRRMGFILKALLILYNSVLTGALLFFGLQNTGTFTSRLLVLFFLTAAIYFSLELAGKLRLFRRLIAFLRLSALKDLTFGLSLITTTIILATNLLSATNSSEYLFALAISPLPLYFWGTVIGQFLKGWQRYQSRGQAEVPMPVIEVRSAQAVPLTQSTPLARAESIEEEQSPEDRVSDPHRRNFLKKAGGIGLGLLAYSLLNPKSVGAAFFGSVPGPGTVSIKDTTDTKIDPAIKGYQSITTHYGISEIDDDDPAYYGFVNKAGNWYILQEDATAEDSSYRYVKGDDDFATNWTGRAGQTYEYFNEVFG